MRKISFFNVAEAHKLFRSLNTSLSGYFYSIIEDYLQFFTGMCVRVCVLFRGFPLLFTQVQHIQQRTNFFHSTMLQGSRLEHRLPELQLPELRLPEPRKSENNFCD